MNYFHTHISIIEYIYTYTHTHYEDSPIAYYLKSNEVS